MARKITVEKLLENALYLGEPVQHIQEWREVQVCTPRQLMGLERLRVKAIEIQLEYNPPNEAELRARLRVARLRLANRIRMMKEAA